MFLRIGGEFNGAGPDWNGGGYHPRYYVTMFRKIVDMFAARGFRDSVATIWCYYPAAANDFDSTDAQGALWYPGDAYADWFGLDLFDPADFDLSLPDYSRGVITRKGKAERFLAMARTKGKPVYMSETSAKGMNLSADEADGIADWSAWFAKFWEFIAAHAEVKGFSYIDANWPAGAYAGWGDARIENSPYVSGRYREEMKNPKYIHLPAGAGTGMAAVHRLPSGLSLSQNYPNPFTSRTAVDFVLPEGGRVTLTVYDALGREVAVLADGTYERGTHTVIFHGRSLPDGVYFCRLQGGGQRSTRTMILVR